MSYEEALFRHNATYWLEQAELAQKNQNDKAQLDACRNADNALTQLERVQREEREAKQ